MDEKNITSIGTRLKAIRKDKGLNQTKMGALFGLGQSTYGAKEKDESALTQDMLLKLYFDMNVNLHWLLADEGGMYRVADVVGEPVVNYSLSERVQELEKKMDEILNSKGL